MPSEMKIDTRSALSASGSSRAPNSLVRLKRLARNPSTASLTPATTKTVNAISIWLDAMAQTMIGTRSMRARVMMFGIEFGILTRRFPATGLILNKIPPLEGDNRALSTYSLGGRYASHCMPAQSDVTGRHYCGIKHGRAQERAHLRIVGR